MDSLRNFSHRTSTLWRSIKILYNLPEEKVKAFVDSYSIYDHDWKDEEKYVTIRVIQ